MGIDNPDAAPFTRELYVPCTYVLTGIMAAYGQYPIGELNAVDEQAFMSFVIPWDFSTIVAAEILVNPRATQGAANWDTWCEYGQVGQPYNAHADSDQVSTYNVTLNEKFAVDVAGILSSLAALDSGGISLRQKTAGHNVNVIGFRLRYT